MPIFRRPMVMHATRVLGVVVSIDGSPSIFLWKKLLDFPGVWLDTNREFEVFLGDGIPEL